jgi:flagellar hook-basal body complex protein FliE
MIDANKQAALLQQMRQMAAEAGVGAATKEPEPERGFASVMGEMVEQVNRSQSTSAGLQDAFAAGDPQTSLTETVVAMQKARVHFETLVQVRNRLVSAYEEIMRMPV